MSKKEQKSLKTLKTCKKLAFVQKKQYLCSLFGKMTMEGIRFDEFYDAHKNHPDKFWQAYLNYVIINKYTLDIEPRIKGDMKAFALKLIQANPQKEVHHWCIKADDF